MGLYDDENAEVTSGDYFGAIRLLRRHGGDPETDLDIVPGADVQASLMRLDRLRCRRFIGLTMAMAPIADHVDNDILPIHHAKIQRNLHNFCDGFRIITVYMKNRSLDHSRHFCAIGG